MKGKQRRGGRVGAIPGGKAGSVGGRIFSARFARRHACSCLDDVCTVHSPLTETFANEPTRQDRNSKQKWRCVSGWKSLPEERRMMRKARDSGCIRALTGVSF